MRHTKKRDFSIFFSMRPCLYCVYVEYILWLLKWLFILKHSKFLAPLPLCIFVYERTWGFFKRKDLLSSIISPFVVISPSIPTRFSDDVGKKIQINISHTENGKDLPLIDNRSWPLWCCECWLLAMVNELDFLVSEFSLRYLLIYLSRRSDFSKLLISEEKLNCQMHFRDDSVTRS